MCPVSCTQTPKLENVFVGSPSPVTVSTPPLVVGVPSSVAEGCVVPLHASSSSHVRSSGGRGGHPGSMARDSARYELIRIFMEPPRRSIGSERVAQAPGKRHEDGPGCGGTPLARRRWRGPRRRGQSHRPQEPAPLFDASQPNHPGAGRRSPGPHDLEIGEVSAKHFSARGSEDLRRAVGASEAITMWRLRISSAMTAEPIVPVPPVRKTCMGISGRMTDCA